MKNLNLMMFMPLYTLSILFPLSSSSWLTLWMSLEMNMFIFILTMTYAPSMFTNETKIKYFLIQSFGSLLFLLSLTMNFSFFEEWSLNMMLAPTLALMLKMGSAPLHIWVPDIASKLPKFSLIMFLTTQKLPVLFLLFSSTFTMIPWIAIFNISLGALSGLSESSLIKLLVYSSVNNIGWMMMSMLDSYSMFLLFFLIYALINLITVNLLSKMKTIWVYQLKSYQFMTKMLFYINMLSLSGLPPLLGFPPKWLILTKMTNYYPTLTMISIIFAIPTMYFYLKMTINMIMNFSSTKKWMNNSSSNNFHFSHLFFINILGLPALFILT
uniref:NADH-ubiquinone oxidoreductase chain 2 n=1 Tax=Rhinocola aceris TaxID=1889912 RepID=A0A343KN38_9HEMI|nr:NADH dehydrogenase subunit 2 [Rhinocola aceris]